MRRNAEMFRAVAGAIEQQPERYYQGAWSEVAALVADEVGDWDHAWREDGVSDELPPDVDLCGTTHCVAGWAVELSDEFEKRVVRPGDRYLAETDDGLVETYDVVTRVYHFRKSTGGRIYSYSADGRRLLGVTEEEASVLFGDHWRPLIGDAPYALRRFADGAPILMADAGWR